MNAKKLVSTQHVKYIETLSRIQNLSLLHQLNNSVDGAGESSELASNTADSYPMGGASELTRPVVEPVKPAEPVVAEPSGTHFNALSRQTQAISSRP